MIDEMEHSRPPRGAIWGFNRGNPRVRQDLDPILVVDRSHHGCRVIAEELAAAGYHVEWTNDPGAAPRMIAARRYSLFIAGQGQPALTGPAIVAAVWHDPTLPVLLIEAVTEEERRAPDTEFLARVRSLVRPRQHDS